MLDIEGCSSVFRLISFTGNDQNNVLESADDDDLHNRDYSNYIFTAKKDPAVDRKLQDELETKAESEGYQEMLRFRRKLPAYNLKDQIVDIVQKNQVSPLELSLSIQLTHVYMNTQIYYFYCFQVVIISGETGCGKTTQVAQFILDSEIASLRGSECNIICTQPRRISAISVAERVARERDERLGDSVGYSIRLEHKFARRRSGKITFMTTGVIFQCLQGNPNLETVSHLIIDEVHERSIHSDFLITMLKDILVRRPNLKVILMSATMNAEEFSKYYNGAPIMNIPGFTYPITTYYLEDALLHSGFSLANSSGPSWNRRRQYEQQDYEYFIRPYIDELRKSGTYPPWVLEELQNPAVEEMNTELIQSLVEYICRTDTTNGAVLIFVTGWDVISNLANSLEACGKFPRSRYRIFPLHSMMPTVNQREIFERPPPGVRKIVIATQIAETSITIDDILWVIDSGKIKLGNFDEKNNIATLDTEWVSIANAMQRRGRAGRVQEGHVYHLFTRAREQTLEKFKKPEVLRTRLEEVILQIKILKLGKAEFLKRLLDPPSDLSVRLALERLHDLHALDDEERLTPLGFHLAQLPMDPQTGKMILMGAIFSCADPIFSIAASLSFKDPFFRPLGKEKEVDEIRKDYSGSSKSDHIVLHRAISGYEKAAAQGWGRKFCHQNFLSENTLKMLINMKEQFAGYLHKLGFLANSDYKCADLNRNSNSIGIITALIAAGLYPNVAKVNYMGRAGRVAVRCGTEKVQLHPGSVNVEVRKFESPYLVYYKKVKSSKIFLHDTTMVSPFALIFFGGQLRWKRPADEDQYSSVIVDGKFEFSYPKRQNFQVFVDVSE